MIVFRIRYKPTGMFYKPKGTSLVRNNLDWTGKIFPTCPGFGQIERHGFHMMVDGKSVHKKYKEKEWEMVSYEMKEMK